MTGQRFRLSRSLGMVTPIRLFCCICARARPAQARVGPPNKYTQMQAVTIAARCSFIYSHVHRGGCRRSSATR